jgi:hypothetical protein
MSDRGLGVRDDNRVSDFLTREQAAEYLGLDPRRLGPAIEPYGIARRYLLSPRPDWYYARVDLEKVKSGLKAAEPPAKPAAPEARAAPQPKAAAPEAAPEEKSAAPEAVEPASQPAPAAERDTPES